MLPFLKTKAGFYPILSFVTLSFFVAFAFFFTGNAVGQSMTHWPVCNNQTGGKTVITIKMLMPNEPAFLDNYLSYGRRVLKALLESVNDRLLTSYYLDIEFLYTGNANLTLTRSHIRDILRDPTMLGHLFSLGSSDSEIFLQEVQDVDGQNLSEVFPMISPLDPQDILRVPFRKNIVNLVGSSQEEISALLNFATAQFGVARIAAIDAVEGTSETLNKTLGTQGRRLVFFRAIPEGLPVASDLDDIVASGAQALFVGIRPELTFQFLAMAYEHEGMKDIIYLVPSLGGTTGNLAGIMRQRPELATNVYSVTTFPPWDPYDERDPFVSINARFNQDIALYDPNVTIEGSLVGYVPSPGEIMITAAFNWFATILDTIPCEELTRESIIARIYQIPSLLVTEDVFIGTFRDDEFSAQCNQAASHVYIVSPDALAGNWDMQDTFSWEGCSSLSDGIAPFLLGSLSIRDPALMSLFQDGLNEGMQESPSNALVLNYRAEGGNQSTIEKQRVQFVQELLNIDKVPLFFGFDDRDLEEPVLTKSPAFSIVDTTIVAQDSDPVEGPFPLRTSPIRLFPDLADRLYAVFSRHPGGTGIVVYDPEEHSLEVVKSIVSTWEEEFVMQDAVRIEALESSKRQGSSAATADFVAVASLLGSASKMASALSYRTRADTAYLLDTFVMEVEAQVLASVFSDWIHVWTESAVGFAGVQGNESILLQDFLQTISTESNDTNHTPLQYTTYLASRLIARVLLSINGLPTPDRIFETMVDLQVFSVDSTLSAGPYSEDCGKGGRSSTLLSGDFSSVVGKSSWSTCGAQREAALSDGSGKGETIRDVVISVAVVGAFLLLCLCCLIIICACMAILVVLAVVSVGSAGSYFIASNQAGYYDLFDTCEPDWIELAFPNGKNLMSESLKKKFEKQCISKALVPIRHGSRALRTLMSRSVGAAVALELDASAPKGESVERWLACVMCYKRDENTEVTSARYVAMMDSIAAEFAYSAIATQHDAESESTSKRKAAAAEEEIDSFAEYQALLDGDSVFGRLYRQFLLMYGASYAYKVLVEPVAACADTFKRKLHATGENDKEYQGLTPLYNAFIEPEDDGNGGVLGGRVKVPVDQESTLPDKQDIDMEAKFRNFEVLHTEGQRNKARKQIRKGVCLASEQVMRNLLRLPFPAPLDLLYTTICRRLRMEKRISNDFVRGLISALVLDQFLCEVLENPAEFQLVKSKDDTALLRFAMEEIGTVLRSMSPFTNKVAQVDTNDGDAVYERYKPSYCAWLDSMLNIDLDVEKEEERILTRSYKEDQEDDNSDDNDRSGDEAYDWDIILGLKDAESTVSLNPRTMHFMLGNEGQYFEPTITIDMHNLSNMAIATCLLGNTKLFQRAHDRIKLREVALSKEARSTRAKAGIAKKIAADIRSLEKHAAHFNVFWSKEGFAIKANTSYRRRMRSISGKNSQTQQQRVLDEQESDAEDYFSSSSSAGFILEYEDGTPFYEQETKSYTSDSQQEDTSFEGQDERKKDKRSKKSKKKDNNNKKKNKKEKKER